MRMLISLVVGTCSLSILPMALLLGSRPAWFEESWHFTIPALIFVGAGVWALAHVVMVALSGVGRLRDEFYDETSSFCRCFSQLQVAARRSFGWLASVDVKELGEELLVEHAEQVL